MFYLSDCKLKNAQTALSADGTVTIEKPLITWSEREKMDSEYMNLMAELGQGDWPDHSKMSQSKCIISRNGGPASGVTYSIEASSSSVPISSHPTKWCTIAFWSEPLTLNAFNKPAS